MLSTGSTKQFGDERVSLVSKLSDVLICVLQSMDGGSEGWTDQRRRPAVELPTVQIQSFTGSVTAVSGKEVDSYRLPTAPVRTQRRVLFMNIIE